MKLAFRDIEPFVKKPNPKVLAVLIYGPDEGLVRERMDILTRHIVSDPNDPFNVMDIEGGHLSDDPARLLDEAKSISMLGGRRVIRLRSAGDSAAKACESLLKDLNEGDNMVLVEAGELGPRSNLRLLFERMDNAVALPCYADDARNIGQIIASQLREAGYSIDPEALQILGASVLGDRGVARREVEKLITYLGDESVGRTISVDEVIACSGDASILSFDDLTKNTASGQFVEANRILEQMLSEGMPPVTLLRALQNYFTRLHITRARMEQGEGQEKALAQLKPPLFFKVKNVFIQQLNIWGAPDLDRALSILRQAELQCKQSGMPAETICSQTVFTLSMAAQKLARKGQRAYR